MGNTFVYLAPPTPSTFTYKSLPFAAPEHSLIDLTASCPRCLANAASKPNGSEGECVHALKMEERYTTFVFCHLHIRSQLSINYVVMIFLILSLHTAAL